MPSTLTDHEVHGHMMRGTAIESRCEHIKARARGHLRHSWEHCHTQKGKQKWNLHECRTSQSIKR